jgi:hypothetical protein
MTLALSKLYLKHSGKTRRSNGAAMTSVRLYRNEFEIEKKFLQKPVFLPCSYAKLNIKKMS